MTKKTDTPKCNKELESEIERLKRLLEEEKYQHQEAKETLEAIRTGAVDGIVRTSPEGEQVFILKGADQPYRNLIEEMNEGALLISENGTILYANIGFAGLVDAPLDKVIGTHVSDWVSTRNIEVLNDIIAGNRKNGRRVFEIGFQNTKQQLIPSQVSISKIALDSINASALIITDLSKHMEKDIKRYTADLEKEITERKKAEEALVKKQAELQTILDSSQGWVFYKDLENHFVRVNKAFAEIMGLPKEQLEGRSLFELYPKEEAEAFWNDDKQVIASGKAKVGIEEKMQSKQGQRWVQTDKIPYRDAEGNIIGVIGFSEDITERKKSEETLNKLNEELEERVLKRTEEVAVERQRLYNVLETLPAYVILLDKDYRVPFANKIFRESFGESHGRRCHEYLFGRDSECENCETYKVLKNNKPQHWEWTGPNGHNYEIYDYPFVEADGTTLILEMGIDVTERKKAERTSSGGSEETERF